MQTSSSVSVDVQAVLQLLQRIVEMKGIRVVYGKTFSLLNGVRVKGALLVEQCTGPWNVKGNFTTLRYIRVFPQIYMKSCSVCHRTLIRCKIRMCFLCFSSFFTFMAIIIQARRISTKCQLLRSNKQPSDLIMRHANELSNFNLSKYCSKLCHICCYCYWITYHLHELYGGNC